MGENMDEKKLLKQIKESAEHTKIPDSLTPEAIRKTLTGSEQPSFGSAKNRRYVYRKWLACAAVLALALLSGYFGFTRLSGPHSGAPQAGSADMAAAAGSADTEKESAVPSPAPAKEFPGAASYEEIYQALASMDNGMDGSADLQKQDALAGGAMAESGAAGAANDVSAAPADTGIAPISELPAKTADAALAPDHSETNVQEAGVDEADIVKTDGRYLYILKNHEEIRIISVAGDAPEAVGSIRLESPSETIHEFYVDGDHLSMVTSTFETFMLFEADDTYEPKTSNYTMLYTYDISDRSAPRETGRIKQNGLYSASRKNGNLIYLFTDYDPDLGDQGEPRDYVPIVNGRMLAASDICIPEHADSPDYLVVTSTDITAPDQTVDQKSIVSAGSGYYVSTDNIYVYQTVWENGQSCTQIMKFHYTVQGALSYSGITSLKGYANDSFSFSEYEGNLRVVLTTDDNRNDLYILGKDLEALGSIRDLAAGETVRSARFLGDTGYFVTYRNMDPLFSVDLGDPENPRLLGELKVTGFSSYLHFYGENLLLGIGEETDPESGRFLGIKLSMFDISDPANVKETDKYVIKDAYDCAALTDYRHVMIDPEKNVIGFHCDGRYFIFSYDKQQGFKNLFVTDLSANTRLEDDRNFRFGLIGVYSRGCYVGDTFYLIWNNRLNLYDMADGYRMLGYLDY